MFKFICQRWVCWLHLLYTFRRQTKNFFNFRNFFYAINLLQSRRSLEIFIATAFLSSTFIFFSALIYFICDYFHYFHVYHYFPIPFFLEFNLYLFFLGYNLAPFCRELLIAHCLTLVLTAKLLVFPYRPRVLSLVLFQIICNELLNLDGIFNLLNSISICFCSSCRKPEVNEHFDFYVTYMYLCVLQRFCCLIIY